MSITTIAASPASFSDNLGLLTMPSDCQGYYLIGTDQALSVIDQMGGAPATITGPVDYKQGYADFRSGGFGQFPSVSPSRDRTVLIVCASAAAEAVDEGGTIVWPPTLAPGAMRYSNAFLIQWNGSAQFFTVSSGSLTRTESGDLAADTAQRAQRSFDPIAYTDGAFTPQFWGGGVITASGATTVLSPAGHGIYILGPQAFSGTPAAASKTTFGNKDGVANSHSCIAAIAQFPTLTVDQAKIRLDKMLSDVSRRIGYRVRLGEVDASA